ncbi:ATP-dependent DNA ligase [Actinomycetota bacterium]
MARSQESQLEVDGRRIRVTNLDKVLYPETGTTKGEVLAYYQAVAPWFVAHNSRRPATRKRWVDGVGTADKPGQSFFSKNLDSGTPDWVDTVTLEHRQRSATYPLVDDAATLVWLGQIASLEIHVPQWRVGPRGGHNNPDRLVLDLDPGEGAGLPECIQVARLCKEILNDMGLPSVPVTSGSKGIHLYAALDGRASLATATTLAKELARALEADHPDLVVADMKRALRGGKVFLDWSQNNGNKTTVAPYSLRGRARPFVAAPRSWDELTDDLHHLEYAEVLERLSTVGDLLAPLLPAEARVESRDGGSGAVESSGADRLGKYRSMRDGTRTPEPVPDEAPAGGSGNSFVIQEHHARRLHHDFRLERDGVLVSWALPKGPPTDPKKNHLAVMTEDHPLAYGKFEGSIPKGQYGAGEVTIWDAGTYECEKWIDCKEIIATLHGRPDGGLGGTARFALIHTGRGDKDNQWLIHRMALDDEGKSSDKARETGSGDAAYPSSEKAADLPRIEPMLATLGSEDDVRSGEWAYETKWDGYRAVAEVADGTATFRSRNGLDVSARYPELQELAEALGGHSAVLDGEIVALDGDGRSSFGSLQNRGDAKSRVRAHYMVFDVMHLDGRSLLRTPYLERREVLESLGIDGAHVHVPVTFGTDRELALRTSRELHLEGVIAKTVDGVYQPGGRARTWVKIKNVRAQEVIVVGWTPGSGSRSGAIGSLLLAVTGDDGLEYAGKVGTGFNAKSLAEIGSRLARLERKTPPLEGVPRADAKEAHWVTPSQVGEVAFTEWTSSGRLRHPSWRGWRPDKSPDEVVRGEG